MTWLLFTIISVIFGSVASILQKALMKADKSNSYSYSIIYQLLIAVLNLPVAAVHGFHVPALNVNLIFFILAASFWAGAGIFLFKALKLIDVSEINIVSSSRVIFTILASIFFLRESFNSTKVLGTALILVSILLVTNLKRGFKFNEGFIYTLIIALFSGLAIVVDGFNVRHYDAISYSVIVSFLIVLIQFLFYPKVLKQWKHFVQPGFLKKMLPLGIFSTTQGIVYLLALVTPGVTAQIGTIRQSSVITTVILAMIFLNERDNIFHKVIAAILVTGGVILLS